MPELAGPYDRSVKARFAHPEMVERLMRGFMKGEWVQPLDVASLEPFKEAHIGENLQERLEDTWWRVRCRSRWHCSLPRRLAQRDRRDQRPHLLDGGGV